ncbi:MAG: hypothetical protein DRO40_08580 [Thermoprotei archaeon]|nr:MAG: hypothetical protein DRO40_08580 [Thermoprotei archaeon]
MYNKKYKIEINDEEIILEIHRFGNCVVIIIKNIDGEKLYRIGVWDHGVIKVEKYKTETEEIEPIDDEVGIDEG